MKTLRDFSFVKALVLSTIFFTITPLAIFSSLASLFFLSYPIKSNETIAQKLKSMDLNFTTSNIYGPSEPTGQVLGVAIETEDARVKLLENYFNKYNSPLHPYSKLFVELADKYYMDYRLVPAIAQQESNLCKVIPENTYNCWGWGIHSRGTLGFQSYDEAIRTVTQGIKNDYINKGYNTVEKIMSKYTPSSPGTWASGVNQFMYDIENPTN